MTESVFPTRNYPYRWPDPLGGPVFNDPVPVGKFLKFFLGRDSPPGSEVTEEQRAALADPFVTLVINKGKLPTTLADLLAVLNESNNDPSGVPDQLSFVVAEGGQIPWNEETSGVSRNFRFVVARGSANRFTLFVSTAAPFDSPDIFMQVLAWDATAGAFQFYERRAGSWIWAGSSRQALEEDTRGQGPFDSHVNGGMVMKELELPWLHWHSMAQTITAAALPPGDPLLAHPLFSDRTGAERLEAIVKNNVSQWTQSRLNHEVASDGTIARPDWLMRQVLTTTAPTIASSPDQFDGDGQAMIALPLSFFFNKVGLLDIVGLELNPSFSIERGLYRQLAQEIGLAVRDTRATPPVRIEGDTFFAWPIPEPGLEDLVLLRALVRKGVLSKRFVASLLMVDFPNPIGSPQRAALMRHVPASATLGADRSIEKQMIDAIGVASDWPPGSPERSLLDNMALSDSAWSVEFTRRLDQYCAAVQVRLASSDGLRDFMLLADSRRREFRRRPIAEFDMTLPWVDLDETAPFLRMTEQGTVEEKG